MQLDLFEKDTTALLLEKVYKIEETSENVRKGVFARISKFEKLLLAVAMKAGINLQTIEEDKALD